MFGHRPRFSPTWLRQPQAAARREAFAAPHSIKPRSGFTLVEMLVAVGLTVLMMTMVVTVFGLVMDSIRDSRGGVEVNDRLRAAKNRLQLDLAGLTAPLTPPLNPALGLGYFEYVEGPIGPVVPTGIAGATDTPDLSAGAKAGDTLPDSTVGDFDDMLMFTVVSNGDPFVGRMPYYDSGTSRWRYQIVQSQVAEIVWFVRGNVLYRRALLVYSPPSGMSLPTFGEFATYVAGLPSGEYHPQSIFEFCDISMHVEGDPSTPADLRLVPNTLGDLTKRENRYAHQPFAWPYDARFWGRLGLPTMEEYSAGVVNYNTMVTQTTAADPLSRPLFVPATTVDGSTPFQLTDNDAPYPSPRLNLLGTKNFDAWILPHPSETQDPITGQITRSGTRIGEDVILTNVLGFDVKVWDPGAPIITLNDSTLGATYASGNAVPNGEAILPTDSQIVSTDGTTFKLAIAAALDRLTENNGAGDNDQIVGYGAYVDLNYMCQLGLGSYTAPNDVNTAVGTIDGSGHPAFPSVLMPAPIDPNPPRPQFHHQGDLRSGLWGTVPITQADLLALNRNDATKVLRASVYDTYSTHYETDGINQANVRWNPAVINSGTVPGVDAGSNGIDDNGNGAVDEASAFPNVASPTPVGFAGEKETAPPYPHPLRGIQIKIRVFEPSTRQIREVTLEHEFVSQ